MLTVPGILSMYFSSPFLMTPSAAMTIGIISVPVFHILAISVSKSLHLESLNCLHRCTSVRWDCHICNLAFLIHVISDYDIWLISCYFLISMNWHIPQNRCLFILHDSFWFELIPFICYIIIIIIIITTIITIIVIIIIIKFNWAFFYCC